jgi:hypothetical protein
MAEERVKREGEEGVSSWEHHPYVDRFSSPVIAVLNLPSIKASQCGSPFIAASYLCYLHEGLSNADARWRYAYRAYKNAGVMLGTIRREIA